MLKKFLIIALVIGGLIWVANNPKTSGQQTAEVANEVADTGGGLLSGLLTFASELDLNNDGN